MSRRKAKHRFYGGELLSAPVAYRMPSAALRFARNEAARRNVSLSIVLREATLKGLNMAQNQKLVKG